MFVKYNIVQNALRHAKIREKTDEELLQEHEQQLKLQETDHSNCSPINDPKNYTGWKHYILKFSGVCRDIAYGNSSQYFNSVVILVIILAGLLVGLETYPAMNPALHPQSPTGRILNALDDCVLAVFCLECFFKIMAEGFAPQMFFTGKEGMWNTFDLFVVLLCMPFSSKVFGKNSAVFRFLTRLFRLARLAKIIHKIPALEVIVHGLVGGLSSIQFIVLLLILVYYLFAVMGVFLFKANDPLFFRSVPVALMTLFRASTLENWSENFKISRYGCDVYDGGFYFSEGSLTDNEWDTLPNMYKCLTPNATAVISYFYWIAFTFLASLVMLSLFVGIVTMNMQESMAMMRREAEESERRKKLFENRKELNAMADLDESCDKSFADDHSEAPSWISESKYLGGIHRSVKSARSYISSTKKSFSAKVVSTKELKRIQNMQEMKDLMSQAWHGTLMAEEVNSESNMATLEAKWNLYLRSMGSYARRFVEHPLFNLFMTCIILTASVEIGIVADMKQSASSEEKHGLRAIEIVCNVFFVIEIVLRMVQDEFNLVEYFSNRWNLFDFVIVVGSLAGGTGKDSQYVVIFRMFRLLRVLKVLKAFPQLGVIVNALLMGISSIGYIGVIMLLGFYVFAIIAVIFFGENDKVNFGDLHTAMMSLFQVATLDNWGTIMFINVYGCDKYPPPPSQSNIQLLRCTSPKPNPALAVIFFITFIIIGSFLLLTLFVGVVTTSMEEAQKNSEVERDLEKRVHEICNGLHVPDSLLDVYRRVFSMLDMDGSGSISPDELKHCLTIIRIQFSDEELMVWIKEVDINFDGEIDLVEFVAFMTNLKRRNLEKKLAHMKALEGRKRRKPPLMKRMSMAIMSSPKEEDDDDDEDEYEYDDDDDNGGGSNDGDAGGGRNRLGSDEGRGGSFSVQPGRSRLRSESMGSVDSGGDGTPGAAGGGDDVGPKPRRRKSKKKARGPPPLMKRMSMAVLGAGGSTGRTRNKSVDEDNLDANNSEGGGTPINGSGEKRGRPPLFKRMSMAVLGTTKPRSSSMDEEVYGSERGGDTPNGKVDSSYGTPINRIGEKIGRPPLLKRMSMAVLGSPKPRSSSMDDEVYDTPDGKMGGSGTPEGGSTILRKKKTHGDVHFRDSQPETSASPSTPRGGNSLMGRGSAKVWPGPCDNSTADNSTGVDSCEGSSLRGVGIHDSAGCVVSSATGFDGQSQNWLSSGEVKSGCLNATTMTSPSAACASGAGAGASAAAAYFAAAPHNEMEHAPTVRKNSREADAQSQAPVGLWARADQHSSVPAEAAALPSAHGNTISINPVRGNERMELVSASDSPRSPSPHHSRLASIRQSWTVEEKKGEIPSPHCQP